MIIEKHLRYLDARQNAPLPAISQWRFYNLIGGMMKEGKADFTQYENIFTQQYYQHYRYRPLIETTPPTLKNQQSATSQKDANLSPFTVSMIKNINHNVALLRANWYGGENKLVTFTFGSAFMLTENVALTCTHNIYSTFRRRFADQVELIVDIGEGLVGKQYVQTYRKSIKIKDLPNAYFQNFATETNGLVGRKIPSFEYQPKKQEITLLALTDQNMIGWQQMKEDKELSTGLPIGNLQDHEMVSGKQLRIVGYPSEAYKKETNLKQAYVKRQTLTGYFSYIQAYSSGDKTRLEIINHTIPTSQGFSGSPILATRGDKVYAIGMHTHRGREEGLNSGVYFDSAFLKAIKTLEGRIKLKLAAAKQDTKRSIQFIEEQTPKPELSRVSEQLGEEQEQGQQRLLSQSDCSERSKMVNYLESSSRSYSQHSEMEDLGLLDYFTLQREEDSQLGMQSCCRSVLIHPSLLLSDMDGRFPLQEGKNSRNQIVIQG